MTVYGYFGWACVLASLGVCCAASFTDNWRIKLGIAAALLMLTFSIQFNGIRLVGFVASIQSEPSVAMLIILGNYGARSIGSHGMAQENLGLLRICALLLGLVMYPSALGIGYLDLYAVGYHPYTEIGLLIFALLSSLSVATRPLAVWATLALLASAYGAGESDNVLDYLIDPIIFLYLISQAVVRVGRWSYYAR